MRRRASGRPNVSIWLHVLRLTFAAAVPAAASAADVSGRIVDAGGRSGFGGAHVTLEPVGLDTVSARDGTFRIDAVSDGDYVLRVEYGEAPTLRKDVRVRGEPVDLGDIAIGVTVTELGRII